MSESNGQDNQDKSDSASASSAHSRINIPINLENWRHLPESTQQHLMWFHQYALDNGLQWQDASEAMGYDRSTVYRVLKGTYEGSWANVVAAIVSYKRIAEQRGEIQSNRIVENGIVKLIGAALDYALANNSITLVIGESRMGKSESLLHWRDANNHGRSVYVVAPPYGGNKLFLRRLAEAVGVNRNLSNAQSFESISRAFNPNRVLLIDEAHRLLPNDRRSVPVALEIVRDIHDQTGCAVGLCATQRFDDELKRNTYQYEQLLGRIGMPVRLPRLIDDEDFLPIVKQYVKRPGERLVNQAREIANAPGRLGILVETLKVASRIAGRGKDVEEEHVFKAIKLRQKMMGELQFAKK